MNHTLLGLVAVIYTSVAVNYLYEGRLGMVLAFLAYALANLGFMWDLKR